MRLYNVLGEAEEPQKTLIIAYLRQAQNRLILAWRLGHNRTINQGSRSHEYPYEAGTDPCVFWWRYTSSLAISPFTCQWTLAFTIFAF
jgi:hypothetical protein